MRCGVRKLAVRLAAGCGRRAPRKWSAQSSVRCVHPVAPLGARAWGIAAAGGPACPTLRVSDAAGKVGPLGPPSAAMHRVTGTGPGGEGGTTDGTEGAESGMGGGSHCGVRKIAAAVRIAPRPGGHRAGGTDWGHGCRSELRALQRQQASAVHGLWRHAGGAGWREPDCCELVWTRAGYRITVSWHQPTTPPHPR